MRGIRVLTSLSLVSRQVITNLVGNAIKFTSKGEVVITVSLEERMQDNIILHFAISDTGIGKNDLLI